MAERHPAWINGIDAFEARLGAGMPFMTEGKGDALDPIRVRSGIRDSPMNPGQVTLGTNQVTVNPFQAVIADPARPGDGAFLVTLDTLKTLPLQGADPSLSRIDLVLAVVTPDAGIGFEVSILQGQNSATPQRPTVTSTTYLELAEITVRPAGTSATLQDKRRFTGGLGGLLPVRGAGDRPAIAAGSTFIYRLDTGNIEVQRGSGWTVYRPSRGEGWTTPPLENSWVNYGQGYATAAYTRTDDGWVRLRGLIRSGLIDPNGSRSIFTLPVGYRPPMRHLFSVETAPNENARVDVMTSGAVVCLKGNNGWLSLDGISFATY
ncbi:hypothetical protein JOF56_003976 [Kibdelosporangium banguiense]|uniref:Uncharacterized protein n=1 Tax=Kibdelosporangium banguiense TaxID=1365924 RepID=A0ABS4TIC9_9PSEU|nr:hypothetical protein [Kibdelosporangium banguiense]MBP2323591.1 hypothetical protein [Kibdelosporangium banguiense]